MDKYLNEPPIISLKNITKKFGDNEVLSNVNFDLHKCEVHALLGENGAGKTTLMNILYGLFPPTSGTITVNGTTRNAMTTNIAINSGIGMVHQHFMLVEPFTVVENIMLGEEITKKGFLDYKKARKDILELSKTYGFNIDPDAKIEDITVGMQQRVENLKALYRGAEVIIFDEPTAVMTPQEIEEFVKIVKKLTTLGKSIIIITHKLSEIKSMADNCTIIRRGKFIDKVRVKDIDENTLADKMVGRNVSFTVNKKEKEVGKEVLRIEDLHVKDSRGLMAVNGLNLTIRQGEILGLAGVDGNGQSQLIEALSGLRKVESGKIYLNGKDITNLPPRKIIDQGLSSIPEDRQKRGLVLEFDVKDNMVLESIDKEPFSKNKILKQKNIKKNANKLIEEFDIRPNSPSVLAENMSGGNQQKVIIAREISLDPDLLIAAQPTRGLDVGAIEFIHKQLIKQRDNNKAVLLISFELDEILDLSDRIAVIYEGKISGERDGKDVDTNQLGRLMAGGKDVK
ncbi:MAG: ABC transporter ATP-binding protein [Peptoniphilaceae bacterium]|nr:ABC transporter ATP-binding protein [Peptoniphilaceae bacterium]MDD7383100.1 ABC transporter ATP-binding protein [Peptoniphilaceae bacterium]MDY3737535.1 ABC transporter ATP-binding protein [Peptoniphilaceae bacterium]